MPAVVEHILASFISNTFRFKASWVSKTLAVVFLLLSCLGTRGRANVKFKGTTVAVSAAVGLALIYGSDTVRSFALGAGLMTALYVGLLSAGDWLSRYLDWTARSWGFQPWFRAIRVLEWPREA